tara:strand:+ start:1782 stop:2630 length:849 start_codon:yes stop_codon:yes gene_type:complete
MTKDRNKYLVSTHWLERQLGNPELRIIDASWYLPDLSRSGSKEYRKNHITGASFFDLDEFSDQNSSLPHMALDPKSFAKKIEVFGISANCTVVVYDGLGIFSAARLLWLLHLYGFGNAFILDGGFPKWLSENRSTDSKIKTFENSHFPISYKDELVVDLNQVRGSIESSDIQIVDARPTNRFLGSVAEPRAGVRRGNIPSSINLFYGDLINPDCTLKPNTVLRKIVQKAGINLEKRLITSCGSGVTAAILYIVFKGLGAKRVSVYDGSWCEWGTVDHEKTLT